MVTDHELGIAGIIIAVVGIAIGAAIGIYGIQDGRRGRAKKDSAIDELRSVANSTHSFLVLIKASSSNVGQSKAIDDQLQKITNGLAKAKVLAE